MITSYPPLRAPRPTGCHELSQDQLDGVVAEVRAADFEHGLIACFAVARALGLSADTAGARLSDVSLPAWQCELVAEAIADAAEGLVPGSSSEVLADWVQLGPGVARER